MASTPVAVLDIGSNSIKILVATRAPDGGVAPVRFRTIDARIGAGISRTEPRLGEDAMTRGLEAIRSLLADAADCPPERIRLVATSAVRDARNGGEFRRRVADATGHEIRILTGEEEANLIGRGLTCDPALRAWQDFYVFDLGGGSLECLSFRGRRIEQARSLQLGCVRLTEMFVADPSAPLSADSLARIKEHTRDVLRTSGFAFSLPGGTGAIGTGGTVSTVRAILAARDGVSFERTNPEVTVGQLGQLLDWLGALSLAQRRLIPGLPPARADVFPTALATVVAVAEAGSFPGFRHSVHNLRYGLADEMLGDG